MSELPYVFDLLWDIKTETNLKSKLFSLLEEAGEILDSTVDAGIKFSPLEQKAIKDAVNTLRCLSDQL